MNKIYRIYLRILKNLVNPVYNWSMEHALKEISHSKQ